MSVTQYMTVQTINERRSWSKLALSNVIFEISVSFKLGSIKFIAISHII